MISRERLKDTVDNGEIQLLEDFVLTKDDVKKKEKIQLEEKKNKKNIVQLDSDSEEEEKEEKVEENVNLRTYKAYISYDMYYHTPRFWLSGVDY